MLQDYRVTSFDDENIVLDKDGKFKVNQVLNFKCPDDLNLVGSQHATCGDSETFYFDEIDPPHCEGLNKRNKLFD